MIFIIMNRLPKFGEDINAMMTKETNNELDSILMARELSASVAEGLEGLEELGF